ncbi:MAG: acetylxylan esterase [Verrucomicrobiia bacterium]
MIPSSSFSLRCRATFGALVLALTVSVGLPAASGAGLSVLPPGEVPQDRRLQPPKDLDGYFPFTPSATPEQWEQRAERVRVQMQVALGLWPAPEKTPLNPVIHGKVERDGFTVEKVFFESVPGFFVTGSLYRPSEGTGRRPGVLSPHGHWDQGRFMEYSPDRIRQEIANGAERFEEGGRSPLQARCAQLARMGCVVFHYDMIGYADSQQISFDIAHRFAKQRPEMNSAENWGLFSPQAEEHLQSVMGLQTLNSVRALDFLLGLPDVDPRRIGVTGASGGGTQTFILCGIDSRPTVAFPAVMVSTAMQGGCTCENASLLRVDTGNVEFAALFAPKPLGLTAADDWTREMSTKGFPELKKHFAMVGAPDNVMLKALVHFEHNYNHVSRTAMYNWFNKHFQLGLREPVLESDFKRLSRDEMTVWNDAHPQPPGGPEFERGLLKWLTTDAARQLEQAAQSPEQFRKLAGPAIDVMIGRNLAEVGEMAFSPRSQTDIEGGSIIAGLLRNTTHREEVPVVVLTPAKRKPHTVIWTDEAGKAGLFTASTGALTPKPAIKKLLDAGVTVVGVDLLYQGEFLNDGKPLTRTPRVQNPREAAAYTFGFNRAVFAQRVHDILSVVSFAQARSALLNEGGKPDRIDLAGLDATGPIVAAARAQCGNAIDHTALSTQGFRFGRVSDLHDPNFLPGGAKYGDLPGMLALAAPAKLWVSGEGDELPSLTRSIYEKAGAANHLITGQGDTAQTAANWLRAGN